MALHGTMQINGTVIGAYSIVRKEDDGTMIDRFHYKWTVHINGEDFGGSVVHYYADGALALIASAMMEADNEYARTRAGRVRPDGIASRLRGGLV